MQWEIEKKAPIKDMARIQRALRKRATFERTVHMKTLLFKKPHFLRLRIQDDSMHLTYKSGTLADISRKEYTVTADKDEAEDMITILHSIGFTQCAYLESIRHIYTYKDLSIELSQHTPLGNFIEVEGIANQEEQWREFKEK